mmetsp:Transcript_53306/g.141249  ORF Transcript_53306/g.141249 Transcript_53306/m.141249 type:complete len:625 (-) Transcript_53306:2102-3976(-)
MSFKGAAGATTPTAPAPHHFKGRPSLEIAAVVSRNATNTEVSAAGQINDQIRRVSLEMAKRLSEDNEGGKAEEQPKFTVSHGLSTSEAQVLLEKWGRNELVEKITPLWLVILRLLTGPMPIMLWIAAIIEGVIENFADMGILLGIQFINAAISFYETSKAGNAVAALKASLKPLATVKRDGKWQNMDAATIVPGDLVLLAAGSAVPADCYVNEGEIEVDQSAMTGESLPVKFRHGDVCKMGSTVTRGEVEGTVETTGQNTFFGKTAAMLQAVDGSGGSLQALLMQVMIVLVSLSLCLCSAAFIYLVVVGNRKNNDQTPEHQVTYEKIVKESLSFAVVVLVASIPLAVEIVTTTTLAMGSRMLSRDGAIVTRLASIESMAGMDMLCSDKTGTLTLNKMVIQDDCPTFTPNENKETVLFQAALAAKWKEPPRDALDTMVLKTGLKLPQGPKAPADGDAEGESAGPAEVVSQADLEEGQRNLDKLNTFTQVNLPFIAPPSLSLADHMPKVPCLKCHMRDRLTSPLSIPAPRRPRASCAAPTATSSPSPRVPRTLSSTCVPTRRRSASTWRRRCTSSAPAASARWPWAARTARTARGGSLASSLSWIRPAPTPSRPSPTPRCWVWRSR